MALSIWTSSFVHDRYFVVFFAIGLFISGIPLPCSSHLSQKAAPGSFLCRSARLCGGCWFACKGTVKQLPNRFGAAKLAILALDPSIKFLKLIRHNSH